MPSQCDVPCCFVYSLVSLFERDGWGSSSAVCWRSGVCCLWSCLGTFGLWYRSRRPASVFCLVLLRRLGRICVLGFFLILKKNGPSRSMLGIWEVIPIPLIEELRHHLDFWCQAGY